MTRYLLAGAAVLALLLGLQTWRIDRVKADNARLKAEVAALTAFKAAAYDDAQTQADLCKARVEAARLSARRIETLIERPVHVDPEGCAVRQLVPADELRNALQPTPTPAEPVR